MAIITVSNSGGNWNATASWVGGVVPLATDSVVFTATSGNLTINVTSACLSIDCTGFTGTLAGSSQLTVAGSVTLGAGMTNSYTGILSITGTGNLNTNGIDIFSLKTSTGSVTITLLSNIRITSLWDVTTSGGVTITGAFDIEITGTLSTGLTSGALNFTGGNTTITFKGNSTLSGGVSASVTTRLGGALITFNSTTTTITGGIRLGGNSVVTHTAGIMTTTGSTLGVDFVGGTVISLDTSGMTWNNFLSITPGTTTLLSNLNLSGTLTIGISTTTINGAFNINTASLTTSGICVGTATLVFNSTGTWSQTAGSMALNTTIKSTANLTIIGSVGYNTGVLTNEVGSTVNTTGSTLNISASTTTTLNTNVINWNNITFTGGTNTLTSNLNCANLTTYGGYSPATINGSNVNVSGNLNIGGRCAGTATLVLNGTGTWSDSGFGISNNLTINTAGTITISGTIFYYTGTLLYVANVGTVVTTGSTLYSTGSVTWNTNGITWNNVTFGGGIQTVSSEFTLSGNLGLGGYSNVTINGSNVNVGGNLNCGSYTVGNATVILNGTGIWTASAAFGLNLTIDTAGTITISGTITYAVGTILYTTGTVITTSSTLILSGSCTLNTTSIAGTISWNNVVFSGTSATLLNNSILNIANNFTTGGGAQLLNGSNINVGGNLTIAQNNSVSGSSKIVMNGTGEILSATTANCLLRCSLDINSPSGTITFKSGNSFQYGIGTITYIAGNVITTGNTTIFKNSCTLDTKGSTLNTATTISSTGINFNVISFSTTNITITNNSPLCIISNLNTFASNINDSTGISGASTYLLGNLYIPYIGSGSSKIIFNGLGSQSWTHATSGTMPSTGYAASYHYIINKPSGTLTLGAQIGIGNSSILDYIQGIVNTTTNNTTFYIRANCTLNTNGINWNDIVITQATITNNSLLTCNSLILGGSIGVSIGNVTFSGTSGFTTGSLSVTTPGRIITLASGKTYNVTSNLNLVGSTASRITIRSLTTPRAIFTLPYGASQNVKDTNATNIDSSLGQTIRSSFGALSNTINWELGQGSWITMMKPQYHE